MPNRRVHRRVGGVSGAAYATYRAFESPAGDPLIEAIGGYLGGRLSAAVPDLLEPACWNHRRAAHGISVGGLLVASRGRAEAWAEAARRRAMDHRALSHDQRLSESRRAWHSLVALFFSFVAGLLNGAVAGYVSHLVLDARTPACIPVF